VILKSKRRLFREYAAVIGGLLVQGWPHYCGIVLDQHAVEERRDPSRFDDLTFLQLGGRENDIIYLPLAGLANGIHERLPNPKVGTVTMDVKSAVEAAKGGEVQFKVEKAGVIHAGIGKVSFDEAQLAENVRAFVDAVSKAKPAGAKGAYLKKVSLSSTMGPGVSVDLSSATA
jgi:hypothetical protein